jgi:hypothetical protein
MLRRSGLFAALVLTAWTMGLEFAHVLEWGPKASYPGPLYVRLQESLYVWYGNIGSVIYVLAVASTVALAAAACRDRAARGPAVAAAAAELVALAVFLAVVLPVNSRFPVHGSGAVPPGWAALRDRWEVGHTIGFVLFTTAFALLLAVVLRPGATLLTVRPGRRQAGAAH